MMTALVRAVVVTAFSVAGSFALAGIILPATGAGFSRTAILMCVLCPVLISFPVSYKTYRNRLHLIAVNRQLAEAHDNLRAVHRLLAEKSRRDEMTGLLNRETFFRDIELLRAGSRHGHLLIIDADNFKDVNDTHGHLTGDEALKEIAGAIRGALREDDLVARIGGEEFAAFLPDSEDADALELAERVRAATAELDFRSPDGVEVPLTLSIGAARDRAGLSLTDLMRTADRRLYEAKRAGRNRVVFPALSRAA
jgi:diguanylate cyclase (GGDEF)-like protein